MSKLEYHKCPRCNLEAGLLAENPECVCVDVTKVKFFDPDSGKFEEGAYQYPEEPYYTIGEAQKMLKRLDALESGFHAARMDVGSELLRAQKRAEDIEREKNPPASCDSCGSLDWYWNLKRKESKHGRKE